MLGLGRLGEAVVALEIMDAAIVLVDMLARPDRGLGEADDLPELLERLALADRPGRHLVALGDAAHRRHPFGDRARQDRIDRDDEVVVGMEADEARLGGALRHADGHHGGIGRRGHD